MISDILRHGLRFLVLVLVQGLVLKNMELGPFVNPFLYVLFIIQLPFELPAWIALIVCFITGISVDVFYNTMGMHAAVCTLIGFMRPALLRFMSPRDGYESAMQPNMQMMGKLWFVSYAGIIVLIHHFLLFMLEVFSFHDFFWTLLRIVASAVATLVFLLVTQLLFYRNKAAE